MGERTIVNDQVEDVERPTTEKEDDKSDKEEDPFDPEDTSKVIHRKIGVWDFYEPKKPRFNLKNLVGFDHWEKLKRGFPHALQLAQEVTQIPHARKYLVLYTAVGVVRSAVMPAFFLWSSASYLELTQGLLQKRPVELPVLLTTLLSTIVSRMADIVVDWAEARLRSSLNRVLQRHYEVKAMRIIMSLDVPTYSESGIVSQLDSMRTSSAWGTLPELISTTSRLLSVATQGMVLGFIFLRQKSSSMSVINVLLSALPAITNFAYVWRGCLPSSTWAATCRNEDYIRMEGLSKLALNTSARQEIVAGNLAPHVLSEWEETSAKAGHGAQDLTIAWEEDVECSLDVFDTFIAPAMWWLPEIFFCISAIRDPVNMAETFASMQILASATSNMSWRVAQIPNDVRFFVKTLDNIQKYYEATKIRNKMVDGTEPFSMTDVQGFEIEFRDVSFKYPKSEKFALEKVSFTIPKGGMCVIVGTNGSGKSTLLKMLLRIYDPEEGVIFVDGKDVKTLRMADLRQAIATLFQSFTAFPLSIAEDIGMGDPAKSRDRERITKAAELGGATQVIEKLPKKFDTFLTPPVMDHYSMLPKHTKSLFGVKNLSNLDTTFGYSSETHSLSGGEYQRLALSRTFMRTMNDSEPIGLLLFDEPSAALDPEAEYALFERMIELRGQRTMIFSSHRFGKLTKHADVILYMKDSKLVESGTHEELLKKDGGYASMYKVQAEAFTDKPTNDSKVEDKTGT